MMKTKNLLKLVLTMVAMFVMTGAMAQDYPAAILNDYENVVEDIYQTTGVKLFLYVAPDPAYHPDYVAAYDVDDKSDNTGLNATSAWRWELGAAPHSGDDLTVGTFIKDWTVGENYVELLPDTEVGDNAVLPATGSITVRVMERFGEAGCLDDLNNAQTKVVNIVDIPTISIAGTTTGGWTDESPVLEPNTYFVNCGGEIGGLVNLTIAENGSLAAMENYTYGISVTSTAYDANMDPLVGYTAQTIAAMEKTATPDALAAGKTPTFAFNDENFTLYDDAGTNRTRDYFVTLTANSLRSTTTKVSNYRAGLAYDTGYPVAATTITFRVALPPVTGPIYHIPNGFTGF